MTDPNHLIVFLRKGPETRSVRPCAPHPLRWGPGTPLEALEHAWPQWPTNPVPEFAVVVPVAGAATVFRVKEHLPEIGGRVS